MFDAAGLESVKNFRIEMNLEKYRGLTTGQACDLRADPDEPLSMTALSLIAAEVALRRMTLDRARELLESIRECISVAADAPILQPALDAIELIEKEDAGEIVL